MPKRRKKTTPRPTTQRGTRRKARFDAYAALLNAARFGPWALAVLFLAVSMPHLSQGFCQITGCSVLTGWLLAVAIDSAQVISKLQLTIATRLTVGRAPKLTALGVVLATTGMSMALNVMAFMQHAEANVGVVLAWVAGLLLPLLVLSLSFSGSAYCLAGPARTR